ncbi:MAG: hypothetical protein HC859_10520 [Bacteroidia bacterium]|nr:hypothetical protein [Bacteroidia bacterium]
MIRRTGLLFFNAPLVSRWLEQLHASLQRLRKDEQYAPGELDDVRQALTEASSFEGNDTTK